MEEMVCDLCVGVWNFGSPQMLNKWAFIPLWRLLEGSGNFSRILHGTSHALQHEKERCTHLNAEFQRIARRDKKAFLSDQCKEIAENNSMRKTRDLFKKIRYQGNISSKEGHNKGQKW